jgi:N-acylneuraminate cytidylyltransferase
MWRLDNGRLFPLVTIAGRAEAHSEPRQSLPEVYWQNGYVDIVRPGVVLERNLMAGAVVIPFLVEEPVLELDYERSVPDLEAALEALGRGEWPPAPSPQEHPV